MKTWVEDNMVRSYLYEIIPDLRLMAWFKSSTTYNWIFHENCNVPLWYIREIIYIQISSYCGLISYATYNFDEKSDVFIEFHEPRKIEDGLNKYYHSYDYLLWLLNKLSERGLNQSVLIVEKELGKRNAENNMSNETRFSLD